MSPEQAAAVSLDSQVPVAAPRSWTRHLDRRVVVVGAPVVYLIALGVVIASWGLPVARDQLFLWIGLGLLAFSVSAWRSWGVLLLEWLPFFALLVAYDFLRGAAGGVPAQAHVLPQIDFDKALFGGAVPSVWLQHHLWSPAHFHWYDYGIWCVYMTHFFTIWIVAAVLWRVARDQFRRYALMVIVLTVGALLTYWLYPAQPPWLHMNGVDRIVPLVWGHLGVTTIQSAYENGDLVNTVAAMPSLHAAYPFLLLLFFWPAGWPARVLLGAYTLAMAFTLVYGGEHFVADIVAGWLMALAAWALVNWVWSKRIARSANVAADASLHAPEPARAR